MKRIFLSLLLLIFCLTLIFIFIIYPKPALYDVDFSTAVYDKNHQLLRLTLTNDDQYRLFVPLKNISPQLIETTLLQEDRYFYSHWGVNPLSLIKAAWHTYVSHQRRIGGSTLTMQVARMRFHINSHTLSGKCWQIIRALQLEAHYSKSQILEAYLNLAPYGNNIEGVGSASLIFYHKPVRDLNLAQALTLSVIPQNPIRRSPEKSNNVVLKNARDNLFDRWIEVHPQDVKQRSLIELPLQIYNLKTLPFKAPHFVDAVLQTSPTESELITTLDYNLQKILERITQKYIKKKNNFGINNAVAMFVDTRDMSVQALIGSADFFNRAIGGQVNGTQAKRSPGSALKPFIYALALDQGLIHPSSVLKDSPMSFGDYNPENFDYDFFGPVKAVDALNLSRNIPAIYLASQLKNPSFYEFLQSAHVSKLKSEHFYGLSLVLGSAEVTMEELAKLYATLANNGSYRNLRYLQNSSLNTEKKLLSPEAAFLTLNMLEQMPRPEETHITVINSQLVPVAWKTGTSSGYHDAWSAAVVGPYVLVVWIGNFDNTRNPAFVGKEAAAPLLFNMIDAINAYHKIPPRQIDKSKLKITQIAVCDASGMLPTRYCPSTTKTWFIPGKSPIKKDNVFQPVMIDYRTGLRSCHFDSRNKFVVYEFWPSDLLRIFKRAGIARLTPPPFKSDCNLNAQIVYGMAPQINSPQSGVIYTLSSTQSNSMPIPFSATAGADVQALFWFVNDRFLGQAKRDEPFFWNATPGKYIVRVVDEFGHSDAIDLVVRQAN